MMAYGFHLRVDGIAAIIGPRADGLPDGLHLSVNLCACRCLIVGGGIQARNLCFVYPVALTLGRVFSQIAFGAEHKLYLSYGSMACNLEAGGDGCLANLPVF